MHRAANDLSSIALRTECIFLFGACEATQVNTDGNTVESISEALHRISRHVAAVVILGISSIRPAGFSFFLAADQVDQAGAQALHTAARYLRVDVGALSQALTTRAINIRGEVRLIFPRKNEGLSGVLTPTYPRGVANEGGGLQKSLF